MKLADHDFTVETPTERFIKWSKAILSGCEYEVGQKPKKILKERPLRCRSYARDGFIKRLYRAMPKKDKENHFLTYQRMRRVCLASPIDDFKAGVA